MRAVPTLDGNSTFQDKCDVLHSSLFLVRLTNTRLANLPPPREDLRIQLKTITLEEISQAIKSANQQSAPGHNKITNNALAVIHKTQPLLLTQLFNVSITHSHYPASWKYSTCVVIPKPNRDP